MSVSEVRKSKASYWFMLLDQDNDQHIIWDDLAKPIDHAAWAYHVSDESPHYDRVYEAHIELWRALTGVTGKGVGKFGPESKLGFSDFVNGLTEHSFSAALDKVIDAWIYLLDVDEDDHLTPVEYLTIARAFGADNISDMESLFRLLDADSDGLISSVQFRDAIRQYFYSDDPTSPGNYFFGVVPALMT